MREPEPFVIGVHDDVIRDLRYRLARARFLEDSPNKPPSGLTIGYLKDLVSTWQEFDWREREQWLNAHPQFTVELDDVNLHFVHLRSDKPNAPALLVMHGWPHTFALQLDFADLLHDFNVVIPSLPGFGFSSPYQVGEWSTARVAATMHQLMTETLGYSRFLTYGEDVSADINDFIAAIYPKNVAGIVVTHAHFPSDEERKQVTDPDIMAFFDRLSEWNNSEGGYAHAQGTRPDTTAAALNDSPVGLLAWIVEKLVEWSDTPAGDPALVERRISRERLLTEAMIYWVSQSIGTSFRPYYEGSDQTGAIPPVTVPAAVFIQRHEADYPELLARDFYKDLRSFERLEEGGHFAVAEVPELMADRVRTFAQELGLL